MQWRKMKMKVSLAAQTLSASVADAIEFCRDRLKLKVFEGSEATFEYIGLINKLFDICNSRNPFRKGTKSPLRPSNEEATNQFFDYALSYLKEISDLRGTKMVDTPRKTAFLGFMMDIHLLKFLYKKLVKTGKMKYLLTYKLSQDHLELFFCALRGRLGANNNPTAQEFKYAYKRLLLHNQICGDRGN
jgi:hypothetical protein